MQVWLMLLAGCAVVLIAGLAAFLVRARRAAMPPAEAMAELAALGIELARLPGRLRRVANDPRTPRRARWLLICLAIYVASPIDPIPDVIPVIGHLDEVVIVPIVLRWVRRMIPTGVWNEYFPSRSPRSGRDQGHDPASGDGLP